MTLWVRNIYYKIKIPHHQYYYRNYKMKLSEKTTAVLICLTIIVCSTQSMKISSHLLERYGH